MNRFFGWWMAVCVVLAGCCGCGRQGLPVPEFPLEAGVVEAALERAGLPWTIAAEESWAEGQTVYTLHDPEGWLRSSRVRGSRRGGCSGSPSCPPKMTRMG